MSDQMVEVFGELEHETEEAWLVEHANGTSWLPKSCCEHDGEGNFIVPEWLAIKQDMV